MAYMTTMFSSSMSAQSFTSDVRSCLTNYTKFKKSTLFQKVQKMYFYCLSYSMFECFGLTFRSQGYSQMEEDAMKRKHHGYPDMIFDVMDSVLYVIETIERYYKTGQSSDLLFGFTDAEAWVDRCYELDLKSKYIRNPEAADFNLYKYLADLKLAIEQGESLLKYDVSIDKTVIKKLVHSLKKIDLEYKSSKHIQKTRKAPFMILVEGTTSVGKSGFMKTLMYHYAKVFDLPTGDEHCYTRIFQDEFWSGFSTAMWCLVLDDVAFMLADKQPTGDASLAEVIQIGNNVSFCPPQASLEDKGKVPFLGRLTLGSTNTLDLGAHEHFRCPIANLRRWHYAIRIKPKREHRDSRGFLNVESIPPISDTEYHNLWTIQLCRAVPIPESKDNRSARGKFESFAEFDDINMFLAEFSKLALAYDEQQEQVLKTTKATQSIEICRKCFYTLKLCECMNVQSSNTDVSYEAIEDEGAPSQTFATSPEFSSDEPVDEEFDHVRPQSSDEDIAFNVTLANQWGAGWFAPLNNFWTILFTWIASWYSCRWFMLTIVGRRAHLLLYVFGYYVYSILWETFYPGLFTAFCYICSGVYFKTWKTYGCKWFAKRCIGRVQAHVAETYQKNKCLTNICLALSTLLFAYRIFRENKPEDPREHLEMVDHGADFEITDTDDGKRYEAKIVDEQNVWYKEDFSLSACDLTETILSQAPELNILNAIGRNTFIIENFYLKDTKPKVVTNRMLGLRGQLYVTNKHGCRFREDGSIKMVISVGENEGVNPRNTVIIMPEDMYNPPDSDLLFLNIKGRPPVKDITKLFPLHTVDSILRGKYLVRSTTGAITIVEVEKISKKQSYYVAETDSNDSLWFGTVKTNLVHGECGSPMVACTELGTFVLGIHLLGGEFKCAAINICLEDILIAEQKIIKYNTEEGYINITAPGYARHLGDLALKSIFRYLEKGEAKIYGSFTEFRTKPKSMVRPSIIEEELKAQGLQQKWTKPDMRGWKPWRLATEPIIQPKQEFDHDVLKMCVQDYEAQIRELVDIEDFRQLREVDWDTAINGAAGVKYVDKINRNTSMGAPFRKSKRHFIAPTEEDPDRVYFDEIVMGRCRLIISTYESGRQFHPVFTGSLKDEALTWEKALLGKIRMFAGAPGDWCLVVRKYLISFIRMFQSNSFAFEGMPGVNCHSRDWGRLHKYLTKFGEERMIAGDFKAFDKGMFAEFILASFTIIRRLHDGFVSAVHCHVIDLIALDIAYPTVDVNGDLVQFFGFNPSGQPLTVIINCMVHSLYIRYCFYVYLKRNGLSMLIFREHVALATYGDDGAMGVRETIPWFTHTYLQNTFAEIGIGYTMADKKAESIPYIPMSEVSFLKRVWKFDERFTDFVAPLEIDSINKSLMITVVSRAVPRQEQLMSTISSALVECFYHGKDMFDRYTSMLKTICEREDLKPYITDTTFPEYEKLIDNFNNAKPMLKCVA